MLCCWKDFCWVFLTSVMMHYNGNREVVNMLEQLSELSKAQKMPQDQPKRRRLGWKRVKPFLPLIIPGGMWSLVDEMDKHGPLMWTQQVSLLSFKTIWEARLWTERCWAVGCEFLSMLYWESSPVLPADAVCDIPAEKEKTQVNDNINVTCTWRVKHSRVRRGASWEVYQHS